MTTWSNPTENVSSFSQKTKNATTFSNQPTALDQELLIGDGFFLNIGGGFRLLIDNNDLAIWSSTNKN